MADVLPIVPHIPAIHHALKTQGRAIVTAAPGAGKTTWVPLSLLEAPFLKHKKILMLEPRRLATRMAAGRMAELLGEPMGKTVGYQIRHERVIGPDTRIIVMTEGVLTRKIQHDPELVGVGLVIFDEFHERSLNTDLGLALCLEISDVLRKDLRLLVMSATMETESVSRLMGHADVIRSEGISYPVETIYRTRKNTDRFPGFNEKECASQVVYALENNTGDILVFLPGAGEIRQVHTLLMNRISDPDVSLYPLYGNLDKKDQDAAIRPSIPGLRKVVLATSIAETSLTIQGVNVVIDSGYMRVPRYYPGYSMGRLETIPVSKASADQRRGRAGRLGPGVCYRLWTEEENALHPDFNTPEIIHADLADFTLELGLWGVREPDELKWLDLPPRGAYEQARNLLIKIGALDQEGRITDHGKELAALGLHPRLGHMLVLAKKKGKGSLACLIAACLNERDLFLGKEGRGLADIRLRLAYLADVQERKTSEIKGYAINHGIVSTILTNARKLEKDLGIKSSSFNVDEAGTLLAWAYPERIAMAVKGVHGSYKMASGTAVFLSDSDPMCCEPMIVCAELDGKRKRSRIYLAATYSMESLEEDFGHAVEKCEVLEWDTKTQSVTAQVRHVYDQLVLRCERASTVDPDAVSDLMIDKIRELGIGILPWTAALVSIKSRSVFIRNVGGFGDFPDLSDSALEKTLEQWLKLFITGVRSLTQLKRIDLQSAVFSLLSWNQRKLLDELAPTHVAVPSGSHIPLDYQVVDNKLHTSPLLSVRLQEMFGCMETPRIAGGRVPVTVQLLSPAGRVMQVTKDLESFWKNTYEQVKKDLKGRYPKHYWPDDPYSATATNRTKKNMDKKS